MIIIKKILIIQTAFIGDVILATAVVEKLHQFYPDIKIDFLLRKGNEPLFNNHPFIHQVLVWNKKQGKVKNLFKIATQIRKNQYDLVINLQRFLASGILTIFSKAKQKIGFEKNPLSAFFTKAFEHKIGNGQHEVERNLLLIKDLTDSQLAKPKLYPDKSHYNKIKQYTEKPYICLAPASVWFTKQLPIQKWQELIISFDSKYQIYLLGSSSDHDLCGNLSKQNKNVSNLAGKLNFLESTALMKGAKMNYVNDSAPLHLASSVNAPVTVFFCSTIPDFGFGPLSDNAIISQTKKDLNCRPCGLHGKKACPEGHFDCGYSVDVGF